MEQQTQSNRWKPKRRILPDGTPKKFVFNNAHLRICKLLAASAHARDPWSYHYLPTPHIRALVGGSSQTNEHITDLKAYPHFLEMPDQPQTNSRHIIYQLGKAGADELRESGLDVPYTKARKLHHELMACLFAASFDIATLEHPITISPNIMNPLKEVKPDWPVFEVETPHHTHDVFLEADTGSEAYTYLSGATNRIDGKFKEYLSLIKDGTLKRPMILFATTRNTRVQAMLWHLRKRIDADGLDRDLARHFGFMAITYDRYLNKLPKATAWAVTDDWHRARTATPFNFTKPETW